MTISKEDIRDLDIVDAIELASDGYYVYLTTTLVSTNNIGNIITINIPSDGEGLITGLDHIPQSGDRIRLVDTSGGAADGYHIINSIISETSFSTISSIASSTGGSIYFMHQVGAKNIGFDPAGLITITSNNVQDAIKELSLNSISEVIHKSLRHLIHFIDDGPGDGFLSGAYKEILPISSPFPTSIIWWESDLKLKKILEKTYIYNGNKTVSSVQWEMYNIDGITILTTITDNIVYSGIFESNRTRIIS